MIKLTDREAKLVVDELQLDTESETTKALTKMFYAYYYQLNLADANNEVYNPMFEQPKSDPCPAIYHSPVNSRCVCCEDSRDE